MDDRVAAKHAIAYLGPSAGDRAPSSGSTARTREGAQRPHGTLTIGPIQFDQPWWLVLAPTLIALAWLIGRRGIAGLTPGLRVAAFSIRALLIVLLVAALAAPSWRKGVDDIAVVAVLDVSDSMPPGADRAVAQYLERAAARANREDRLGVVLAASAPLVAELPGSLVRTVEPSYDQPTDTTDLAAGVRLATAVLPQDAAPRIVLVSDGNETGGGLLAAAQAARAAGVVVDVLPIEYDIAQEVVVDQIIAPATARRGQTVNLRFAITATRATRGRLSLFAGRTPIDLDPTTPGDAIEIPLERGVNAPVVPVTLPVSGAQRFRAVFEPLTQTADAIAENNTAEAVTFVTGEGRVLVYADSPDQYAPLLSALEQASFEIDVRSTPADFTSVVDLAGYDAVVLAGTGVYGFSLKQQEELRAYVHDIGGGLVVVGGPDALGAGGWIGSPLADALPVKLDPPQEQRSLMGALAIVLDASGSMSSSVGVVSQQTIANEAAVGAVRTLTVSDEVVVLAFDSFTRVIVPLTKNNNPEAISRAIRGIGPGGGTNMYPALARAALELEQSTARSKHIIVLSDGQTMGDPTEGRRAAARVRQLGGTLTAIAVGQGADVQRMEELARIGGGRFFALTTAQLARTLPAVFIRDVQTALRTLIWEGDPASPTISALSEPLRGVGSLPPYTGYVVTTAREGLSVISAQTHQGDPLIAQWQHGLGRAVVFTSDATTRWNPAWTAWSGYQSFWEQHVRWAMRPTGNANLDIVTQTRGDTTRVIVNALDQNGEPLNFAAFRGRVVSPEGKSAPIELRMTAPGRYEGTGPTAESGVHALNIQYDATGTLDADPEGRERLADRGSVQAAIVKPQAAESRTLTSNAALLERVAQAAGGRVLTGDPDLDDLFAREGLPRAVASRSIWLPLALLALGVFLTDVAVRRVRIDRESLTALAQKFTRRESQKSEAQVDALRSAREKARSRTVRAEKPAASTASVKFEADPDAAATGDVHLDSAKPQRKPDLASPNTNADATDDEQSGMSRLMQAKRRAQQARHQNPDHRSIDGSDTN